MIIQIITAKITIGCRNCINIDNNELPAFVNVSETAETSAVVKEIFHEVVTVAINVNNNGINDIFCILWNKN